MVATLPGSGSFSIEEKRNCIGQVVNASTRDGERLVGTGNMDIIVGNARGVLPCDVVLKYRRVLVMWRTVYREVVAHTPENPPERHSDDQPNARPGHPSRQPGGTEGTHDNVLAAQQAFYDAFESRTIEAMDAVWEHSDDVLCTHPGWPTLTGWRAVRRSWETLLGNSEHLQFIVTDTMVVVRGEMAFVRATENLLADGSVQGTITALNVFARQPDGSWRMLAHHGNPVLRP